MVGLIVDTTIGPLGIDIVLSSAIRQRYNNKILLSATLRSPVALPDNRRTVSARHFGETLTSSESPALPEIKRTHTNQQNHKSRERTENVEPGVVADGSRLHFCPLRIRSVLPAMGQYGPASAPAAKRYVGCDTKSLTRDCSTGDDHRLNPAFRCRDPRGACVLW